VDHVLDRARADPPQEPPELHLEVIGSSVRVTAGTSARPEEPPAKKRAEELLAWLAATYPPYAGRYVAHADLEEHLWPQFQAATGCKRSLASVVRGLNKATDTRDRDYIDPGDGRRRIVKEYLVPRPAAAVVDIEVARKRA
jgi:hypothetical protein